MWVIVAMILGAVAAVATILEFPYQVGLLRPSRFEKPVASGKPSISETTSTISQQEIAAWTTALATRRDCDSLKKYVLDYPTGHYVNAAQTILSAKREITEDRWVTFDFPSNVVASSSLDSRSSRELACASAREQLAANMADGCGVFSHDRSQYRSVTVVAPRRANCECQDEAIHIENQASNPLWHCTIRATYSCRGEQLQHVRSFVCN